MENKDTTMDRDMQMALQMALDHIRMLARSPVTATFLIEEINRLGDQILGKETGPVCRCLGPCDCPVKPPYRAPSPEARLKEIEYQVRVIGSQVYQLETKYKMAAADDELKALGLGLEDLWRKAQDVPLTDQD